MHKRSKAFISETKILRIKFEYIVAFSLVMNSAYAGKDYTGIFTTDIYDQTAVLARLRENNTPKNQYTAELENELLNRKKKALNETCHKRAHSKLQYFEEKFQIALNAETKRDIINELGTIGSSAPLVGYAVGSYAGLAGGVLVQVGMKLAAQEAKKYLIKSHPDYHVAVSEIAKDMQEIALEMFEYENDLNSEPILPFEIQYIHKKRNIKSEELKKEIESQLVNARLLTGMPTIIPDFLKRALKLPIGPRKIEESLDELEDRFDNDLFFSGFEPDLQKQLKGIIRQSARDSRLPDDTIIPMRQCYYFFGPASTGKSEAARKIPQFLGLPYIETSITQSNMHGTDYMEGSYYNPMSINLGKWVEPFLQEIDGQTFTNSFLIINDSDDILDPTNPSSKTFYTSYLDSNIKEFFNKYFNSYIPLHRLITIITSNKKQERTEENAALMSRLTPIHFPRLGEKTIKNDLNDYLDILQKQYVNDLPDFIKISYLNPDQLEISYEQERAKDRFGLRKIIKNVPPFCVPILRPSTEDSQAVEIRDLKNKYLRNTIDKLDRINKKEREEYFRLAELSFQRGDREAGDDHLKQAALKGHQDAINQMIISQIFLQKQQRERSDSQEAREKLLSRIGRLYEEIITRDKDKKWWAECLGWFVEILPEQIEQEQPREQKLLGMLLSFPRNYTAESEFSNQIGNRLYQIWLHSTTNPRRDDCLKYSAALRNQDALDRILSDSLPRLGLQDRFEGDQQRLHKSILQKLIDTSGERTFAFSSEALIDKNDMYRKIINSTQKNNHFNSIANFLNIKELFKLFSVCNTENRVGTIITFIENFKKMLHVYDSQSYSVHFLFSKPKRINNNNLEEDLKTLTIKYEEFKREINI